jgi:glutamate-1-semialdehyde aminotransferase
MTTLNTPAEVELADLLCDIHPWAEMVRYCRSGGEAMAIAVRIARAATGRDVVAFCGYHGWSDWYLAANLAADDALDGHLLPGLEPKGVPRGLLGTALPFQYNRIEELEAIASERGREIAAIVMEPFRYQGPAEGFLEKVRGIADRLGAVLVFDEITSGWRHHFGGVHLRLEVEPDVAVFAKALSNGYPMGAVTGRRSVMDAAQTSFISSTFWTEAIGPTAALAAIEKMRRIKAHELVGRSGRAVQDGWLAVAAKHGLDIAVTGLPALCTFSLDYAEKSLPLVTLLTQCMLERGYLATNAFYGSCAHDEGTVARYLEALGETFGVLRAALDADDVERRLKGPVAHAGFRRLT